MLSNLLLKFQQFNQNLLDEEESERPTNKRSNSQKKYQQAPDIMTQAKPNSFNQPINPHKSAFTPTNRLNKFNSNDLLLPPKNSEMSNKKTLILDLDETLVHSSFTPFEKNDIILDVDFEGVMYNIYVLVRPDAQKFIKTVAKFYEVVIFTASISKYASPLLDILDNEKNIKYRLYRDHCTYINGIYIKDLKKLNRSLKDLIIVDNSPIAYAFDADNGLPIKTWVEDPNDKELMKLIPILEFLSKVKDVRKYIDSFVYGNEILYEEAMEIIKIKELTDKKFSKNIDNINCNSVNINNINVISVDKKSDEGNEDSKKEIITNNINNKENKDNKNNKENKENKDDLLNINSDLNSKNNNKDKQNGQVQKKKNAFRLGIKKEEQKGFTLNSLINNNKFDPSIPLTLSTNTTKNLLSKKNPIQYKNTKDKQPKNKSNNKDGFNNNIKQISLKDIVCDKNKSKKNKYVNLLEKFQGRDFKSYSSLHYSNKQQIKNNKKNNKLRISSSIGSYRGFMSNGELKTPNAFHINRSSSTGNFFKFNNGKMMNHPKTPKDGHFSSKFLASNGFAATKNKKIFNVFDGINYSSTTRNRKLNSTGGFGNGFKMKKNAKK